MVANSPELSLEFISCFCTALLCLFTVSAKQNRKLSLSGAHRPVCQCGLRISHMADKCARRSIFRRQQAGVFGPSITITDLKPFLLQHAFIYLRAKICLPQPADCPILILASASFWGYGFNTQLGYSLLMMLGKLTAASVLCSVDQDNSTIQLGVLLHSTCLRFSAKSLLKVPSEIL